MNADTLRQDIAALRLIKDFAQSGKIIAAILHGPWALIDAGVIKGKTLTAYKIQQVGKKDVSKMCLNSRKEIIMHLHPMIYFVMR